MVPIRHVALLILLAPHACHPLPLPQTSTAQMELQLGELVDELTGRLPEASVHMLDELAEQLEEVEERLERFKVRCGC